jgi:hypothetical protein
VADENEIFARLVVFRTPCRQTTGRTKKEESSARLEWDETVECGTSDKNRRRERRRAKERG